MMFEFLRWVVPYHYQLKGERKQSFMKRAFEIAQTFFAIFALFVIDFANVNHQFSVMYEANELS